MLIKDKLELGWLAVFHTENVGDENSTVYNAIRYPNEADSDEEGERGQQLYPDDKLKVVWQ